MAPELIINEEQYVSGVDVYAFAFITYEITTKTTPYNEIPGISLYKILSKVGEQDYRPIFHDHFNTKMKNLISRCWDKYPERRPLFEEIFNTLSRDFSSFDEDIDENEISDYIETLTESEK